MNYGVGELEEEVSGYGRSDSLVTRKRGILRAIIGFIEARITR